MKCTSPTWLKSQRMYVPCGWCVNCLMQRRREWAMRIQHELIYWDKSAFITLTYDEVNVPYNDEHTWMSLRKEHVQLYIKRLRKEIYPKKIKYFLSGEYGPKRLRPHYHAVLLGLDWINDMEIITQNWPYCIWSMERIQASMQSVTSVS